MESVQINLPASKSICNRVLIINALAKSAFAIDNLSDCDDTQAIVQALSYRLSQIDIGAAGTAMRFLTAFLANTRGEYTITGSERMKQRPIKILVEALREIGANITYLEKEGFPPLKIKGCALHGGEIKLNSSVSSQYISALMMIAPYTTTGLQITLQEKIVSSAYIKMTAALMRQFGVTVSFSDDNVIDILPQKYLPIPFSVESDWSAAAFLYEWLAVRGAGRIFMPALHKNSLQGDSEVANIFTQLGVNTEFTNDGVIISSNGKRVKEFVYDFVNQPDLAQSVAVTCCLLQIPFCFSGLQTLKIKETDRIAALISELAKLGFLLRENGEGSLVWEGKYCKITENSSISTYNDHRMAMAFATAKLIFPTIQIENPEVVSKSYPDFWHELKKLQS